METFLKLLGLAMIAFVAIVIIALLLGFPVRWLWNWLMPSIFGLAKISFWKAFGVNILCGILFRSSPKITNSDD